MSINKATVSVIVPAYNVEAWLGRCIESIINQTYSNLQILIINDGSTDCTGEIAEAYSAKDSRVKVIHTTNAGLVEARETGIKYSQGKLITFVDADDAIIPEMYERLVRNMEKYSADISHCGMQIHYETGLIKNHFGTGELRIQSTEQGLRDLLRANKIEPSLCNKIYNANILKNSCLDKSILNNEDLLRNFVLFSRAKISVFEDFCGYIYYRRGNSMSGLSGNKIRQTKHIFNARKLIVQHANRDTYPHAMALLLITARSIVENYATKSKNKEETELLNECRSYLRKHKHEWNVLSIFQRFLVWLALHFPTTLSYIRNCFNRKPA